jgi:hypothetical protein
MMKINTDIIRFILFILHLWTFKTPIILISINNYINIMGSEY